MARGLLITGTELSVGKTLLGCALAFAAHARGMRVGVMKPVATGCSELAGVLEPTDARGLAYAAACDLPMDLICPYRYRSSLAAPAAAEAEHAAAPDLIEIAEAYRKIAARSDLVIVEGTGGIATPLAWGKDCADLAQSLNLDLAIVAANRPGCVDAARLTIERARNRALRIVGVILNDVDGAASPAAETNFESLRRLTEVPILGRVHFKQPVTRDIIDALLLS